MVHLLRRSAGALAPGSLMLLLAACGGSSTPTSATTVVQAATAATATSAKDPSVLVSGMVVDPAGRPVAGANVECMGTNVTCVLPGTQVIAQDGPDDGVFTAKDGTYSMLLTAPSAAPVTLNAHAFKYELQVQQLRFPDPGCSADQARCAVTVNFRLVDQVQ